MVNVLVTCALTLTLLMLSVQTAQARQRRRAPGGGGNKEREAVLKALPGYTACLWQCVSCVKKWGKEQFDGQLCALACVESQGKSIDSTCTTFLVRVPRQSAAILKAHDSAAGAGRGSFASVPGLGENPLQQNEPSSRFVVGGGGGSAGNPSPVLTRHHTTRKFLHSDDPSGRNHGMSKFYGSRYPGRRGYRSRHRGLPSFSFSSSSSRTARPAQTPLGRGASPRTNVLRTRDCQHRCSKCDKIFTLGMDPHKCRLVCVGTRGKVVEC